MSIRKVSLVASVVLATAAGVMVTTLPAHAASRSTSTVKILALHTSDTFATGQKGVLCQVHATGSLICVFNTATPYRVTNPAKICGESALQGIRLDTKGWVWDCATDVQIIPTKATNAWASPHKLAIDARLHAAIIPNNWTFTAGGLPCHVSSNGVVGCAATKSTNTGFVADSHHVYPRGVNAL